MGIGSDGGKVDDMAIIEDFRLLCILLVAENDGASGASGYGSGERAKGSTMAPIVFAPIAKGIAFAVHRKSSGFSGVARSGVAREI